MKRRILLILFSLVFGLEVTAQSEIGQDEYEVFGVFAKSVILNRTAKGNVSDDRKWLKKWVSRKHKDVFLDFMFKNRNICLIEKKIVTSIAYDLVSKEDLDRAFVIDQYGDHRQAWKNFDKAFPRAGGVYQFSRVGFSKDGKFALINVSYSCGGLCGDGYYYFLKKNGTEWKIEKKRMTFIS